MDCPAPWLLGRDNHASCRLPRGGSLIPNFSSASRLERLNLERLFVHQIVISIEPTVVPGALGSAKRLRVVGRCAIRNQELHRQGEDKSDDERAFGMVVPCAPNTLMVCGQRTLVSP